MTERYWFRPLGSCVCGKAATGLLIRFDTQKPVGPYCRKCAKERIKKNQPVMKPKEEQA